MRQIKGPFTYYGGKQRMAQEIVDMLPEHDHYVEPFAGGLSVLLAKPVSTVETVNDLDGDLMTFWRMLRDRPDDLARVCALTPHSRAEFANARAVINEPTDDLERARLVWVLITQSRANAIPTSDGWRRRVNPMMPYPSYLAAYVERMAGAAKRLMRVSLESRPALDVIEDYGKHPDVLLYVDPPYLASTRNGAARYRHEMANETEHIELAESLNACAATVVISGYASDLYDLNLYRSWHRIELATSTGNGVTQERTEVVWSNRQLGQASLFDEGVME